MHSQVRPRRWLAWLGLAIGAALALLGCAEPTGSCGPGTVQQGNHCVAADSGPVCGAGTVQVGGQCVAANADGQGSDGAAGEGVADAAVEGDGQADSEQANDVVADANVCDPPCKAGQVCQAQVCVKAPPPTAWSCLDADYADGQLCQCGCGSADPDCAIAGAPVVGCPFVKTCNADGSCPPCKADCGGKQCGDDGCGGVCGACLDPLFPQCDAGKCSACAPDCSGAVCGDNGCGGSCGKCAKDKLCSFGACVGPPPEASCSNTCGGIAPSGCSCKAECFAKGTCCIDVGNCQCLPQCEGKQCGDDGCGGACGECATGQICAANKCQAIGCNPLTCNGHGVCQALTLSCTCDAGYSGTNCDQCAAGYVGYPNCVTPCGGAGACDDKEPCTADECANDGTCIHVPTVATCGDNTACVQFGCIAGSCKPVKATDCDDNNACTLDGCDPKAGCVYLASKATACEDEKPCTSGDLCDGKLCKAGSTATNCDDGNACTADSCDLALGCVHAGTGEACTVGDPCSVGGVCQGALCTSLAAKDCNDGKPCTVDSCDSKGGCQHSNATLATPCDDDNACNQGEICDGKGACGGGAKVCDLGVQAGLLAHYTAATLSTLTVASNGAVVQWKDISGNGRHLTAVDFSKPPTLLTKGVNGGRGVRAAGTAGLASEPFAFASQVSVFAAVCVEAKEGVGAIAVQGAVGKGWSLGIASGNQIALTTTGGTGSTAQAVKPAECYVLAGRSNAAGRSLDVIATATTTSQGNGGEMTAGNAKLHIGGDAGGAILAELLVYDHAVSDDERNAIATYLRTAWGFAAPTPDFAWYDAADLATVATAADGSGAVSLWKDKSANGRDAAPGTDNPPIWYANGTPAGKPAIRFDGNKVRLQTKSVPSAENMTVFVVFEMDKPQDWGSVFNQGHDTYFSIRKSDCCGGNGQLNWHIGNNNAAPLLPLKLGTWRVVTAVQAGAVSTWYSNKDATTVATQGAPIGAGQQQLSLGNSFAGNESMGGFLAEVRAYASALGPVDRAFVQAQLLVKHGL